MRFKRKQLEDKMGLDMYAYVGKPGQRDEFFNQDGLEYDGVNHEWVTPVGGVHPVHSLAQWRKHPNLHGWMKQLWIQKGCPGIDSEFYKEEYRPDFNGIEFELSWQDLDDLERAIRSGNLPETTGFFFGNNSDNVYFDQDLKFCIDGKAEIFLGQRVFYNSSW